MAVRTPRDYFEAGLAILSAHGNSALTIYSLCSALGSSKGSFYHHFPSMSAYTRSLMEFWELEQAHRFAQLRLAEDDPRRRLTMLIEIGAELPHEAESALRAWARSEAVVSAVLERIDAAREQAIAEGYERVGLHAEDAGLFARMSLAILLGVQARENPVDRVGLRRMFEHTMAEALSTISPMTG